MCDFNLKSSLLFINNSFGNVNVYFGIGNHGNTIKPFRQCIFTKPKLGGQAGKDDCLSDALAITLAGLILNRSSNINTM